MHHRLPGCSSVVQPDVESSRVELLNQPCPDFGSQLPEGCLLLGVQIKQAGDVLLRDDQRMAFGHGKGIQQGDADLVFQQVVGFQLQKGRFMPVSLASLTIGKSQPPLAVLEPWMRQ